MTWFLYTSDKPGNVQALRRTLKNLKTDYIMVSAEKTLVREDPSHTSGRDYRRKQYQHRVEPTDAPESWVVAECGQKCISDEMTILHQRTCKSCRTLISNRRSALFQTQANEDRFKVVDMAEATDPVVRTPEHRETQDTVTLPWSEPVEAGHVNGTMPDDLKHLLERLTAVEQKGLEVAARASELHSHVQKLHEDEAQLERLTREVEAIRKELAAKLQ